MKEKLIKSSLIVFSIILIVASILFIVATTNKNQNLKTKDEGYIMKEGKVYHLNQLVEVYETTGNKSKMLNRGDDLIFGKSQKENTLIKVNEKQKLQKIKALGAAMTHASAYNINNSSMRDDMLKALFSPTEGAGFNIVRVPIGTSDYGTYVDGKLKHYTLCDTDGEEDMELKNFSLKNDLVDLIPVLKSAYEVNQSLQVILAPWSAPAWMKTSNRLYSGQLKEQYEDVYAKYLVKTIMEYEKNGIKVHYLSILNEPEMTFSTYPVMNMPVDQQIRVIIKVGKLLEENNLDVKIMSWDHNTDNIDFPIYILENEEARKYVSGTAFHGYTGTILDHSIAYMTLKDKYPEKDIYFTEITAGDWNVDFAYNLSYSLTNAILGTFNYHGSIVTYWNYVLDENNMPFFGGAGNSHGILTKALDDTWYSKSSEYYALAHVSKFIDLSNHEVHAINVECSNEMIVASGFIRDDGKIVLVVLNTSDLFSERLEVEYNGEFVSYELNPQSVATFVWG